MVLTCSISDGSGWSSHRSEPSGALTGGENMTVFDSQDGVIEEGLGRHFFFFPILKHLLG